MQLSKIIKYLEKKFPNHKAAEWDQVGMQKFNNLIIDPNQEIKKVLVVLDLTSTVYQLIEPSEIQLIITRHPFIFNDLAQEKNNPAKKEIIKSLTKHKINVYSIHTNYDLCGYNALIEQLKPILPIKQAGYGILNKDYLNVKLIKQVDKITFINHLKTIFKAQYIQINTHAAELNSITSLMINQGSGASAMAKQKLTDCVFITGEAKWSDWIYANDNNIALFVVGHYMENYFIYDLQAKLANSFKQLEVQPVDINNQYKLV